MSNHPRPRPLEALSPEARALIEATGMSRRRFLRGVGVGGAAVAGASVLAACSTPGSGGGSGGSPSGAPSAEDRSDTDKKLNVSNWQLYIDIDEKTKKSPSIQQFEQKYGVTVNYTEDITDNENFYAKVAPQLRAGQDIGRDIMVLTDWMASRCIKQGFVQKIDKANTPAFPQNLRAALKSPEFDPNRDFSAPWQSGLTGIAYNSKLVPPVTTINDLLTRADLKGKISALTEMRDTMGLIMLDQGKDPANFTDGDYDAALAALQKAVDSQQIRKFTGNEYSSDLANGNLAACIAWSGDVFQLQADNPDIKFVAPDAGSMLWSDNMLIPARAQHKKNAERWIDWYYDPKIAAELAAYVNYICPVEGAQAEMQKIDPELAKAELIFPTEAILGKTHIFKGLDAEQEAKYTEQFNKVAGL